MQKTYQIRIHGRVQGVGFRFESYQQFVDLGLTGKAENLPDGSVEVVVTGEEESLQKFVEWAKQGPQGARVNNVGVNEIETANKDVKNEEKV